MHRASESTQQSCSLSIVDHRAMYCLSVVDLQSVSLMVPLLSGIPSELTSNKRVVRCASILTTERSRLKSERSAMLTKPVVILLCS